MRKIKGLGRILSLVLAITMIAGLFGMVVLPKKAEAADELGDPAVAKKLIDNGDGTYTLALSITGAAQSSTSEKPKKANVILVLDTSSSMTSNRPGGSGTPTRMALEQDALTKDDGIIDKLFLRNDPTDPEKEDIIEGIKKACKTTCLLLYSSNFYVLAHS